jgi:hypothetical protein
VYVRQLLRLHGRTRGNIPVQIILVGRCEADRLGIIEAGGRDGTSSRRVRTAADNTVDGVEDTLGRGRAPQGGFRQSVDISARVVLRSSLPQYVVERLARGSRWSRGGAVQQRHGVHCRLGRTPALLGPSHSLDTGKAQGHEPNGTLHDELESRKHEKGSFKVKIRDGEKAQENLREKAGAGIGG